ncbi:type II secretion system F family protein [Cytophaga sp. FL35]|uniref:type II secretion system F family protein n=1 Tax=Cytophaga sp. FL35 TaxID=1904456 RepID=UPI00165349F5|nr:type II secretion system F family protein [Cytophaga sp. FL35]MBC6999634.1 type II secretion system F family protein [Cytophaga sp. FL35]
MGFKLEHIADSTEPSTSDENWLAQTLQKEITFFGKFFGNKKKEDFYSELGVLLKAGISLKEALSLIQGNQKKEKLQIFFGEIVDSLISGNSLFEILSERKEFSEYEYHSVKIGEETGTLSKIVEELGLFYARKNEQRRALISALTYPTIILLTAILVVIFMLKMVVPMFEDIFRQNNVDLPSITKIIVSISAFIEDYGALIIGIFFLLFITLQLIKNNVSFKKRRDSLMMKIPYVGNFIKSVYLTQFTQAVALLTASKVPLLNSIQLVEKMIDFYPLREALMKIESQVLIGQSLSHSMSQIKIFDNKMVSLVKVAEETNQTEYIFQRLNEQYAIEVQQKSKMLSTLMEPLIIILVGLFVGVILVSMYLPMFKLSSVIGG